MPDGRLLWLPDQLRDWRLPVTALRGWETRGRPAMRPLGHVSHHDASPARTGDLGYLAAIIAGRHGTHPVPGPLSQLFLPRGITAAGRHVHVVASGVANHAGIGEWLGISGNDRWVGTEEANDGLGEPWSGWQLDTSPAVTAAVLDGLRRYEGVAAPTALAIDHREYARPLGRKSDRAGIDPFRYRRIVDERLAAGPHEQEDESMFTEGKIEAGEVRDVKLPVVGGAGGIRRAWLTFGVDHETVDLRVAVHNTGVPFREYLPTLTPGGEFVVELQAGDHMADVHNRGARPVAYGIEATAR